MPHTELHAADHVHYAPRTMNVIMSHSATLRKEIAAMETPSAGMRNGSNRCGRSRGTSVPTLGPPEAGRDLKRG